MTTDELKALLDEATPGPWKTHLVDDTTIIATDGTDVATTCDSANVERSDAYNVEYERMEADARLIAMARDLLAEVIVRREREARLVEALRWMGAERNKQMRTADYHGDDCRCYRCAEDAVFAALAEIEKEAKE